MDAIQAFVRAGGSKTYPKQDRSRTTALQTSQENLLCCLGFFACSIADIHAFENRCIEHNTPNAIGPHNQSYGFLILLAVCYFNIHFEGTDAALSPFLVGELEELRFAGEVCLLFLFTGFDYSMLAVSAQYEPEEK